MQKILTGRGNTTPEEFENATIIGHFGFVFQEKKLGQGNHVINVTPSFAILKMTQNNSHVHKAFS